MLSNLPNIFGSKACVGIYVTHSRIYLAESSKEGGRIGFSQLLETAWDGGSPAALGDGSLERAVNFLLQNVSLKSKSVVFSLPGHDTTFRYFEMPLLPAKERRQAAYYEAQKYASLDKRGSRSDAGILRDGSSKKMKVVFFSVRKDLPETLARLFLEKGARDVLMEPSAFSLMRLFYRNKKKLREEVDAFVSIDENGYTDILIAQNRLPLLARDYVIPESSADPASLDYEAFSTELRLSINYFTKNLRGGEVQRLVFFGNDRGRLKGWTQRIRSELSLAVEAADILDIFRNKQALTPGLMIAGGLALRCVYPQSVLSLNLTAQEKPKPETAKEGETLPNEKKLLLKTGVACSLAMIVLTLLVHGYLSTRISNQQKSLGSLPQASTTELTTITQKLSQKLSDLRALADGRIYWTEKMNELAKITPPEIALTSIEYSDQEQKNGDALASLNVSGGILLANVADPIPVINRFVNELKASKEFMKGISDIKISKLGKLEKDELFSMIFSLDGLALQSKS